MSIYDQWDWAFVDLFGVDGHNKATSNSGATLESEINIWSRVRSRIAVVTKENLGIIYKWLDDIMCLGS